MKTVSDLENSEILKTVGMFFSLIIVFGLTSFSIIKFGEFDLTGQVAIGIISAATNLTFIFFVLLQFINQNQTLEAQTELIKAQKAQCAPSLDYNVDFDTEDALCRLAFRNNGNGVAKNIQVAVNFSHEGMSIHRIVKSYQVNLDPGESATESKSGGLEISPREEALQKIREIAEKSSADDDDVNFSIGVKYEDILQNDTFVEEIVDQKTLSENSNYSSSTRVSDVIDLDSNNILDRMKTKIDRTWLEVEIYILNLLLLEEKSIETRENAEFYVHPDISKNEFRQLY